MSVVFLTSCASLKYVYYFESPRTQNDNSPSSNRVDSTSLLTRSDLSTASLDFVIYETRRPVVDTGIVSYDSLSRKTPIAKVSSLSAKEKRKQLREEDKKAYLEARKEYAATKDKRFDGFAIAGAVFFTVATLSLMYPGTAIVFAILGLFSSVLGLKSRIWGLSVASLICAGVILSLYIFMSIILGGPE